jgi:hypothetical protein
MKTFLSVFQILLYSHLLSKTAKIKMHRTTIYTLFRVGVRHGFSDCGKDTVQVSQHRMLTLIFGPKRKKWRGTGENCVIRAIIVCRAISSLNMKESRIMWWTGCVTSMGKWYMLQKPSFDKPEEKRPSEDLSVDKKKIWKWIEEIDWGRKIGCIWLRIGTSNCVQDNEHFLP